MNLTETAIAEIVDTLKGGSLDVEEKFELNGDLFDCNDRPDLLKGDELFVWASLSADGELWVGVPGKGEKEEGEWDGEWADEAWYHVTADGVAPLGLNGFEPWPSPTVAAAHGYDPVGAVEIAARLNVKRGTVDAWRIRHADFPAPRWQVGGRPAWNWDEIQAWHKARPSQGA